MMNPLSRWWNNLSERRQVGLRFVGVAAVLILTVLVSVSVLSYLFSWRPDQSALSSGGDVRNAAASGGLSLGHFLVTESFGLAAFCVVVFLLGWCIKLIWPACRIRVGKWFLGFLTFSFLLSWILAFADLFIPWNYLFGGGMGGRAGAALVGWSVSKVGEIVTGVILLVLLGLWLFAMSRRFSDWIMGVKREVEQPDPASELPMETADTLEVEEETAEEEEPMVVNDTPAPVQPVFVTTPSHEEGTPAAEEESAIRIERDDTLDQEVREPLKPIDNRLDPPDGLPKYRTPELSILGDYANARHEVSQDELVRNNTKIRNTLANYKIQVRDVTAIVGPTVTLYKVYPAPGVKIAAIKQLQEDIGISLGARGVRITTLSDSVGIEVANDVASIVPLKALLNSDTFRESKAELPVAIGYNISQQVKVFDLADAPHLLVAGATKQGKSVGLNVIVASLLYAKHPSELKFVFIDPKMVEFSAYNSLLKHYLAVLPTAGDEEEERAKAIVKNAKDAELTLKSLCVEMDQRYELLSKAGENKITDYNERYKARKLNPKNGHRFLPYLVTIVDEYADLTMTMGASPEVRAASKSITNSIIRLAQKGRAAGIHVIIATQRPSVDVISGVIKGNFPLRIAFRVASRTDSMTILDSPGAEKLIGRGDMLLSAGIENERIQCGFVSGSEIKAITNFIGDQEGFGKSYNTPYYLPEVKEEEKEGGAKGELGEMDERFEEAAKLVVTTQRGSTSDLQRRLGMGYAKAGRVMDQLEQAGIVGPQEGSKPRTVLVSTLDDLETLLDNLKNA